MTVTIETKNYSKQFEGTTFRWFPDKVVTPAGSVGGIYLPKDAIGKQVVAFVLDDDEIEMYVEISGDDIQEIGLENIEIFWHSHPNNDENLSLQDYRSFLQYPHHKHRIYTENGFADYYVRRGFVMRVEE